LAFCIVSADRKMAATGRAGHRTPNCAANCASLPTPAGRRLSPAVRADLRKLGEPSARRVARELAALARDCHQGTLSQKAISV